MNPSETQLRWALQALAQSPDVQRSLFSANVITADELALDFDQWKDVAASEIGASWSPAQRSAITAIDKLLDDMSDSKSPELWLDDQCLNHPRWAEVRTLAQSALSAFGWPEGIPPRDRATYVSGSNDRAPGKSSQMKKL